ncbi:testis-expressed protein 13B [Mustela putorius furo]|uniref:Testis-expressed protein 13B n=1 Tax=Mustela putorius furo TaxID=9669 RepID=A0A8U0RK78_MUSPF|nr:testis-expressed protein 13B [Mustela putorius furo]
MSLKPDDASSGFQHNNVVAFINEKMAGHTKGPEFYLENIALSWEEVENKLRDILDDSTVPSEVKDACAWSSLALGVRFARRQGQLHKHRVQWLHDFAKLHKSAAQALASDLKEHTARQEMERKEAAFRMRQTQANLAEMQKERDLLKWKLFQLGSTGEQGQASEGPGPATASGAGTEETCKEVEESQAASAGATGKGRRRQKNALGAEATKELGRGLLHVVGAVERKNYTTGGQREGDLRKPSDVSLCSDVGSQGTDPQESQRDRRDFEPHQQRRPPIFRRPGDWDCPWCKAVNFSRREICFRCGRGIWLQSPQ